MLQEIEKKIDLLLEPTRDGYQKSRRDALVAVLWPLRINFSVLPDGNFSFHRFQRNSFFSCRGLGYRESRSEEISVIGWKKWGNFCDWLRTIRLEIFGLKSSDTVAISILWLSRVEEARWVLGGLDGAWLLATDGEFSPVNFHWTSPYGQSESQVKRLIRTGCKHV